MIVAIGGGELRTGETRLIDEAVVRLVGKARPRMLVLPTASGDSEASIAAVREVYGKGLGCDVDVLLLHSRTYDPESLEGIFFRSDLVYVGDGDPEALYRLWAEPGIGDRLARAHRRGTALVGLGAGALTWFDRGVTSTIPGVPYAFLPGLGLIPGTVSVHHANRWSDPEFRRFWAQAGGEGLSLDDGCALVADRGRYHYLRSLAGANGWRLWQEGGRVCAEEALDPEDLLGFVDKVE